VNGTSLGEFSANLPRGSSNTDLRRPKKEKGRLLAPLLQSRNETAAKRSPVSPGQADRAKFG
jgi:hypothetical protein